MIDGFHSAELIIIMAMVTAALRFLPFVIFPAGYQLPKSLLYLGRVLPGAIMAMLVVYCFKGVTVFDSPYALPELVSTVTVWFIYLWRGSVLGAISIGTICYMWLVQYVFI